MQAVWLSKLCISRKCWSSPQVQLQCWRSSDLTCLVKAVIPKNHSQNSFMWFWREAFLKRIQGSGHLSIWPGDTKRFPELLQDKVRLSKPGIAILCYWVMGEKTLWEQFAWCPCCIQVTKNEDFWRYSEVIKITIKSKQNCGS